MIIHRLFGKLCSTHISKCLLPKRKSTKQPPEEIQMASNNDIKTITGTKLKYLSEEINEFGANRMFQVLDETPFQE